MKISVAPGAIGSVLSDLKNANGALLKSFPGPAMGRQPVHTVYGGAHIFSAQSAEKIAAVAKKALKENAPNSAALVKALDLAKVDPKLWKLVYERVSRKLESEAVEDFRIDFEDGYGNRPDAEEDGHAESAAEEVAKGMKAKSLPPFIGIRIKPLSDELVRRSFRTLDIFVSTLVEKTEGKLPDNFVVTLPKITITEQSRALVRFLKELEVKTGLKSGSLKYEIMVETTQAILDENGRCPLREFADAGDGRCVAAHFGTYDYTASCGITAHQQTMKNPVCDFAKHFMQVTFAGTPIFLSDGATNVMPIGSKAVVHRAWRLSYAHIQHSLQHGFYQGWDLHPNQLPIRYAATYAFFLQALDSVTERLKTFVEKAAKATLLGDVFDDAATGQGLLNFFLRGMSCGAITIEEAKKTGLSVKEIEGRSFLKILSGRKTI